MKNSGASTRQRVRVAPSRGLKRYLPFIESEFPKLYPAYRTRSQAIPMATLSEGLSRFMRERCRKHGIWYGHSRIGTIQDLTRNLKS